MPGSALHSTRQSMGTWKTTLMGVNAALLSAQRAYNVFCTGSPASLPQARTAYALPDFSTPQSASQVTPCAL